VPPLQPIEGVALMARIRTIKPTIWGDEKVARLSRDARLLYIGLISMADDDGRFLASMTAISGYVFPNDDLPPTKVARWFAEIVRAGLVVAYEHDGIRYGAHLNYRKHQRISHPQPSPLPAPQGVLL
jgi:hypothetical protein